MFVAPIDQFRLSQTAALFEGGKVGVAASCFITEYPPGRGPDLHSHPYAEVFVVQEGTAEFTAGEKQQIVEGGHIVVVGAETPHGFKSRSETTLRVVSIHPSPKVIQTNLT